MERSQTMSALPAFAAELDAADDYRARLMEVLTGRYRTDRRSNLVAAYASLGLEHHRAIITLLRNGMNGSASALVRPLYEAVLRGCWVAKCASDSEVESVAEDADYRFPTTDRLAKEADQALADRPLFVEMRRRAWGPMNSYTHGGLHQLQRRFDRAGQLNPIFVEEELREVVSGATAMACMLGIVVTEQGGREDALARVYALIAEFAKD